MEKKTNMKKKLTWCLFILMAFLILLIQDIKHIVYFPKFIMEFKKIIKRNSKCIEDGDFVLVKKRFWRKRKCKK